MDYLKSSVITRTSLFGGELMACVLILLYSFVFGLAAQLILTGAELIFFFSSMIFCLTVFYLNEPFICGNKMANRYLKSQGIGSSLVISYVLVYGITSFTILSGTKLLFFTLSYIFAVSMFFLRDDTRLKAYIVKEYTGPVTKVNQLDEVVEKNPCYLDGKEFSKTMRQFNEGLSIILGFSELLLSKNYTQTEKHYMTMSIYEQAINLSNSFGHVANMLPNSLTKSNELLLTSNPIWKRCKKDEELNFNYDKLISEKQCFPSELFPIQIKR